MQCEYTPIKPRKRRRAASQMTPSLHCPTQLIRDYSLKEEAFRSRLDSLRHATKSDMPPFCLMTPNLEFPVDELETRSALEDRSGPSWTDHRSDSPLSPFDSLDPWSGSSSRGLSADSLKGFLDPGSRSSLSSVSPTPDFGGPVPQGHPPTTFPLNPTSIPIAPQPSALPPLPLGPSRELFDHFWHHLAPLLVLNDKYNPFLDYLTPLTAYSVVETALHAVSSAQLENLEGHTLGRPLDLHSRALQSLAMSIGTEDQKDEDVPLAATLLLLHYEVSKPPPNALKRGRD